MKTIFTTLLIFIISLEVDAQGCPATNSTFATAALFDPNWILGCTSGTSCSGGTIFDNRSTCEAVTDLDACAPTPSCGAPVNNASDLWFKFYATATTATITSNPSVSMKSAIQAFSVNQATPTCASLIEIGCHVATSVSSVSLVSLTGLTVGNLYYFRVYGSATNAAQRNGTFCFCGSAGLSSSPLAANLTSFSAAAQNNNIRVRWSTSAGSSALSFEVERSYDGIHFTNINTLSASGNQLNNNAYLFIDMGQYQERIFYRLKTNNITGQPEYSRIIRVNLYSISKFELQTNIIKEVLKVEASEKITVQILNSVGSMYLSKVLYPGLNEINVKSLPSGVYFIKNSAGEGMQKFIIQQ